MHWINFVRFYCRAYAYIYEKLTSGEEANRHSWTSALIVGAQVFICFDFYYYILKFTDFGKNENFVSNIKLKILCVIIVFIIGNSYLTNRAKKFTSQRDRNRISRLESNGIFAYLLSPAIAFIVIFVWDKV